MDHTVKGHPALLLLLACILLSLACSDALAQSPQLKLGDRVRIKTAASGRTVGTVLSLSNDTLVLAHSRGGVAIPFEAVQQVEISRGRKLSAGHGAGYGAAIGGTALGLTTLVLLLLPEEEASDPSCTELCIDFDFHFTPGEILVIVLGSAAVGAVTGTLIGAVVGEAIPLERWEQVPLQVSMGLAPSHPDALWLRPQLTLRIGLGR